MKMNLLPALALAALASVAMADVKDGEKYKCGPNGTVTANCDLNATMNTVTFSISKGGNTSPEVTGTPGANGGDTASETPETTVSGGPTCRVKNGKMQYKNANGDWIDCGRPRKNTAAPIGGNLYLTAGDTAPHNGILQSAPGEEVTSLPLMQGEIAPHSGWFFQMASDDVEGVPVVVGSGPRIRRGSDDVESVPLRVRGGDDVGTAPRS